MTGFVWPRGEIVNACGCGVNGIMVGMTESLPLFRYHPDPVATGSVVPSVSPCLACGRARGFTYVGPVYAVEEPTDGLCPWCIADGTAASAFDAEFTDAALDVPTDIAVSVIDELLRRTPGYNSWQQDRWLYHCADACAFLGAVGRHELEDHRDAREMLRHEHDGFGWNERQVEAYLEALSTDGSPTAFLFRCLHCAAYLAYSDAD
jgi:uncharacterized protein